MYENVKTKLYVGAHSKCIYWGKKINFYDDNDSLEC